MRYTRKKKGGVYISEGTYGCVFGKPPLKCLGDEKRLEEDVISKLMNKREAETEYKESEKWRAIDPTQEFSLYAFKMCKLDKENIKPSNNTNRCNAFRNPIYGQPKRDTLLFYKYGGPDLSKLKVQSKNYKPLFKAIAPLIDGLAIAHENNLVHLDIKLPNILANIEKDKIHLRFIDFGLSLNTKKLKFLEELYTGSYPYWPFELKAYDENYGDIISKAYIAIELERFNENKYNTSTLDSLPITRIDADSAYSILKRYNFGDYNKSLPKVDIYSIGVLLSNLLSLYFSYYITDEGDYYKAYYYDSDNDIYSSIGNLASKTDLTKPQIEFHTELYNNLIVPLVKFIRKCTEFDPRERYTTKEAAEEYKKLLPLFDTYLDASKVNEGLANQRILNESPDIPYIKTPVSREPTPPYVPPEVRVPNNVNELSRILENLEGLENEVALDVSPKTASKSSRNSRKKNSNKPPRHPMVLRPRK